MSPIPYQIVHQIPGRIRFKVPDQLHNLHFTRRLQQQLESLSGVTQVQIDPAAASVVVSFREEMLSGASLQEKLPTVLQVAAQPTMETEMTNPKFLVKYKLEDNLTPYEREQIEEIYQWRLREPAFLPALTAEIFSPVQRVSQILIPGGMVDQILTLCEQATIQWQSDWQDIKAGTQLLHPDDLKQNSLDVCDRLADKVQTGAVAIAGTRGGLLALFKEAGVVAEIPLAIALSLRTIHRIGLCYGFMPQTQLEQLYAWMILSVSTAQTTVEKQVAFSAFYQVQDQIQRVVFGELLEETVVEELLGSVREAVLQQTIRYLVEDFSLENLPLISVAIGITANQAFITEVSEAAHHIFQIRWLLSNGKLAIERQSLN